MGVFEEALKNAAEVVLLQEGKTKRVWQDLNPNVVTIENTDRLTAYNGREEIYINQKGCYANDISKVCFSYLSAQGIPNHYVSPYLHLGYDRCFSARKLDMLPVEFVVRHQPYGSYLTRYPGEDYRKVFDRPVIEFFEKNDALGDPWLIVNREKETVSRYLPDRPRSKDSLIDERSFRELGHLMLHRWSEATPIVFDAAVALRKAWARGNTSLVDIKFECGVTSKNIVVIGDTIDADCWRLWRGGDPSDPLDRQLFKDKRDPQEILSSYAFILEQTVRWLSSSSGSTGN